MYIVSNPGTDSIHEGPESAWKRRTELMVQWRAEKSPRHSAPKVSYYASHHDASGNKVERPFDDMGGRFSRRLEYEGSEVSCPGAERAEREAMIVRWRRRSMKRPASGVLYVEAGGRGFDAPVAAYEDPKKALLARGLDNDIYAFGRNAFLDKGGPELYCSSNKCAYCSIYVSETVDHDCHLAGGRLDPMKKRKMHDEKAVAVRIFRSRIRPYYKKEDSSDEDTETYEENGIQEMTRLADFIDREHGGVIRGDREAVEELMHEAMGVDIREDNFICRIVNSGMAEYVF